MDWNPQTLEFLSQSFHDTLSPQPELRRRAEQKLSAAADTPNYALSVLRLVAEPSVDEEIRRCASVNFKNHLKTRWVPSSSTPVPDGEKEQIKTLIVPLMVSATRKIQAQLCKAIAVIGNHDFPEFWSDLIHDLTSSLETAFDANDFGSANGILATVTSLFNSVDRVADEILQQVVIPNVMLRDEDEELFQKNYLEFIRRDMEGNNHLNTTRRIACELLLNGSSKNKEKIREQIPKWLAVFDENPGANWKYKECAIHMVVSLSGTNDVVDVESFFRSVIVPELQQQEDVNAFPMLKAAALKFLTVFRFLIPKQAVMPLLCDLVRYVGSDVIVVHSYAAICIEKLLLLKDNNNIIINGEEGVKVQARRYTSTDIHPIFHESLIEKLFDALDIKSIYVEHNYNHYIMRCMMRVVEIADDMSVTCLSNCFNGLTMALTSAMNCRGVEDVPEYYHFLFEAVARVVRRASETGHLNRFQPQIIHQFTSLWARSYVYPQLFPYFVQLLALLVDIKTQPPTYPKVVVSIIDGICLNPDFKKYWERPANVPILVRLLQSFLQDAPPDEVVNKEGRLRRVMDRTIDKLMSSPTTEELGFRLLNTVIENYEYGVIAEYMNQIWASLFARLQENHQNSSKTPSPRLVRCVIVFMSLFLVKHGVQTLMDLINSNCVEEVNLFRDVILGEFWIPNLKNIGSGYKYTEVKLVAVASTKLLCESSLLLDPAAEEIWGKLLDAIVTLLSQRFEEERERVENDDDDDDFDFDIDIEFGVFVPLRNVGGKKHEDWDPLKEIEDPKQFLVDFPAKVSSEFHGRFPLVIMRCLSPPNQAALVNLCNSYNVAVV